MITWSELPDVVHDKAGVKLVLTDYTGQLTLDDKGNVWQVLFGPYRDADEPENRLYVVWTEMVEFGEPRRTYFQLLVQDCEGDFLNSDAFGAERYNKGVVTV